MPRNLHIILSTVAIVMIAYNVAWRFISKNEYEVKADIRDLKTDIVNNTHNKLSSDEKSRIVAQLDSINDDLSNNYSIADFSRIAAPIILLLGLLVRTNIENEKKSQAFQKKQQEAELIATTSEKEAQ